MGLTKEDVIVSVLRNTTELVEPYMIEKEPNITQKKLDKMMAMLWLRPDMMDHAKGVARIYFLDKFNISVTKDRNGKTKKMR